ncbi:hypothetical protein SAMN06296065_11541 [Novosphingobium panipatense]|uniref:Uncharacterized protein n=1 Tax=Novosphingobium panipatense TaxID=428991 RepID=A0ABY1QTZ2_9SPHN|nr:hypothetical protein SAMN06296065_11541 [Novosphingobium panipatense]
MAIDKVVSSGLSGGTKRTKKFLSVQGSLNQRWADQECRRSRNAKRKCLLRSLCHHRIYLASMVLQILLDPIPLATRAFDHFAQDRRLQHPAFAHQGMMNLRIDRLPISSERNSCRALRHRSENRPVFIDNRHIAIFFKRHSKLRFGHLARRTLIVRKDRDGDVRLGWPFTRRALIAEKRLRYIAARYVATERRHLSEDEAHSEAQRYDTG